MPDQDAVEGDCTHFLFADDELYRVHRHLEIWPQCGAALIEVESEQIGEAVLDLFSIACEMGEFSLRLVPETSMSIAQVALALRDVHALEDIYHNLSSDDYRTSDPVLIALAVEANLLWDLKREVTLAAAKKASRRPTESSALSSERLVAVAKSPLTVRAKRSTSKGEAREKLIAALTSHHRYADGGCLNTEPIGSNQLARLAGVSPSTASDFFKAEFKGLQNYRRGCADATSLIASLKLLNNDYSPHLLLGAAPVSERRHREEDAGEQ